MDVQWAGGSETGVWRDRHRERRTMARKRIEVDRGNKNTLRKQTAAHEVEGKGKGKEGQDVRRRV